MTAPSKTRTTAGDIADATGFVSVDLHEETGQWSVWISPEQWWGFVDADVLHELAGHEDVYGVKVTRRGGEPWTTSLTTLPTPLVKIAHDGLQLATATINTDHPDALFVHLSTDLDAHATVNALLFWHEELTVHDAVFGMRPNAAGFVRLIVRGTLPDGTRVVVVGQFHHRAPQPTPSGSSTTKSSAETCEGCSTTCTGAPAGPPAATAEAKGDVT